MPEAGKPTAGLLFAQEKVVPLLPAKLAIIAAPLQRVRFAGWLRLGSGFTVMVKVCAGPVQPPKLGVTVIVPVCVDITFPALKFKSPFPEVPKPIAELLFVQEKVAPLVPVKLILTGSFAQAVVLAGSVTLGCATTVMVNVWAEPGQLPPGITIIVPVWSEATLAEVKFKLPVPETPRPMAVLLFVQEKEGELPVKITLIGSPPQADSSDGALTELTGLMVMVKVLGAPVQLPFCGVTVIVAICCAATTALEKLIFPVPEAPSPIAGLLLVHEKVGVPDPVKLDVTCAPPQAARLAG